VITVMVVVMWWLGKGCGVWCHMPAILWAMLVGVCLCCVVLCCVVLCCVVLRGMCSGVQGVPLHNWYCTPPTTPTTHHPPTTPTTHLFLSLCNNAFKFSTSLSRRRIVACGSVCDGALWVWCEAVGMM